MSTGLFWELIIAVTSLNGMSATLRQKGFD
jgi:hypothetical protein